jgi:hypothetical protein
MYYGDRSNGDKNGKGVMVSKYGCRYVGEFKDDKKYGVGH